MRSDGGSLDELFSATTGYHFSIRNRDVMVLTGIVTVPKIGGNRKGVSKKCVFFFLWKIWNAI